MQHEIKARYSDSVLDRATIFCFLEDQETRLLPIKTQYATTYLRSSILEAQYASENTVIDKFVFR